MASKWDGEYKWKTKNCDSCLFYLSFTYCSWITEKQTEVCNWGVAFKRLAEADNLRKCFYFDKHAPRDFDRTIEDLIFQLLRLDKLEIRRNARAEAELNYQLEFDFMKKRL